MTAITRSSLLAALVAAPFLTSWAADKPAAAAPAPKLATIVEHSLPFLLTPREPVTPHASGDFAIAVLPDTQMYTAVLRGGTPDMFVAQAEWILSNRVSRNIVYVTTEGDISNDGGKSFAQWQRATNALYRLEDRARTGLPDGIPYGAVVGNHDTYYGGTASFNAVFGASHFAGRSYYGGHYGTNNDSHVDLFSAGGQEFIVVALTMAAGENAGLMQWANAVLKSNATRRAIVVTHSLLNPAPWPKPASWTKEGPEIFKSLTNNPNLFLMLCGHRHGEGRRHEVIGDHAIDVVLSDYQDYINGGDGFMRLMEFSPSNHTIAVKTFSPWTGQWTTNTDGFFTLAWPAP